MIYAGAAAIILAITGALLAAGALRGRRIDDHPICRRCRFDLIGTHTRAARCPECGTSINEPRAITRGNRRRRPRLAALGLIILLAGLAPLALLIYGTATGQDWNTYKPAWWLAAELASRDQKVSDAAISEFAQRIADNALDPHWRTHILDTALARFIDDDAPWSTPWASLLDQAFRTNLYSPQQLELYTRHAPAITIAARHTIPHGKTWRPAIEVRAPRLASQTPLVANVQFLSAHLGERPLQPARPINMGVGISSGGWSSAPLNLDIDPDLPPGNYTLSTRWRISISNGFRGESITTWEEDHTTPLEIAPPGTVIINPIPAEQLTQQISQSVRIASLSITHANDTPRATGIIYLDDPPLPVVFAVYFRYTDARGNEHEIHIGTARGIPDANLGHGLLKELPPDFNAQHIDLILRSCTDTALDFPDVTEIWEGLITFPHLELLHEQPPPRDPPR